MYHMIVKSIGEVIAERSYFRPSECTDNMLIAEQWYLKHGKAVEITMTNDQGIILGVVETPFITN